MDQYRFVYALMVGAVFLVWLAIFFLRKDLRKEILIMSSLIGLLGITQLLYAGVYWSPEHIFLFYELPLGPEDFLLAALFYGGIGSVLYQFVSNQRYICDPKTPDNSVLIGCVLPLIAGLVTYAIVSSAHMNIIYATTCTLLIPAITLVLLRPQYAKAVFVNGLCMGVLAVAILILFEALFPGFIEHTWNLPALSGAIILSVPIEEFYFHFAAGACFAVAYECFFNCRPFSLAKRVL